MLLARDSLRIEINSKSFVASDHGPRARLRVSRPVNSRRDSSARNALRGRRTRPAAGTPSEFSARLLHLERILNLVGPSFRKEKAGQLLELSDQFDGVIIHAVDFRSLRH